MTRNSLARVLLVLGAAAGAGYWLGALARAGIGFEQLADLPKASIVTWKGIATGLLVLSAFAAANTRPLRQLAISVAIIWLADLWLALGYMVTSGVIFVTAHLVALHAYATMGKPGPHGIGSSCVQVLAVVAAAIVVAAGFHLDLPVLFALYPVFSAACALVAARSTMPLLLSAAGMLVFFVSDAVVVLSVVSEAGRTGWGWLSWLTYFGGLTMVVGGILAASRNSGSRTDRFTRG